MGFLVKVSFLLAVGAIIADFLWDRRNNLSRSEYVRYGSYGLVGIIFLALLLFLTTYIFPFFNLAGAIKYWEHFAVIHHNWFQTAIQCVKALLYASPLLVVVPFFGSREKFSKAKIFLFFLAFAFLFYVVLFDFSLGALDRYLQLVVLPLCIFSALAISDIWNNTDTKRNQHILLGVIVSLLLILVQSLPHYVPPLHPKTEWVSRIAHVQWNFLFPFSGGSGPLGFYVSFLFMALSWLLCIGALCIAWWKPQYKKALLFFILPIGIAYNGVFVEEYLIGHWNGNAARLVKDSVQFIQNDPDIQMVTVYNDNGGYEVREIGKYRNRLYVDPKFDINEKVASLNKYKEHYLVINVPRLDPDTVYQKYFDTCNIIYRQDDKKMSAIIYDCRNAPDIKI
jgi:hypothetical protein